MRLENVTEIRKKVTSDAGICKAGTLLGISWLPTSHYIVTKDGQIVLEYVGMLTCAGKVQVRLINVAMINGDFNETWPQWWYRKSGHVGMDLHMRNRLLIDLILAGCELLKFALENQVHEWYKLHWVGWYIADVHGVHIKTCGLLPVLPITNDPPIYEETFQTREVQWLLFFQLLAQETVTIIITCFPTSHLLFVLMVLGGRNGTACVCTWQSYIMTITCCWKML
jgi:hypothetical protein